MSKTPKKAIPTAGTAARSAFPVGVLSRSEGAYAAGAKVTTDPSRPRDPKAQGTIYVDTGRFAAWRAAGAFSSIEEAADVGPTVAPAAPPVVELDDEPNPENDPGSPHSEATREEES